MSKQRKLVAVQLRVAEARQRDVGKTTAKLGSKSLKELGISPGDIVEIVGKKSTVAVAAKADPEDEAPSILRIDAAKQGRTQA